MKLKVATALMAIYILPAYGTAQEADLHMPDSPALGFGYIIGAAIFRLEGDTGFGMYAGGNSGQRHKLYERTLRYTGVDGDGRYWMYRSGMLEWAFAIKDHHGRFPVFVRAQGRKSADAHARWKLFGYARRVPLSQKSVVTTEQSYVMDARFSDIAYGDKLYAINADGDVYYYDLETGWTRHTAED